MARQLQKHSKAYHQKLKVYVAITAQEVLRKRKSSSTQNAERRTHGFTDCNPNPSLENLTQDEGKGVCTARVNDAMGRAEPTYEPFDQRHTEWTSPRPNFALAIDGQDPDEIAQQMLDECLNALGQ